jgi:Fungal Zn(2)-Cys(6) binuclear cluster domain
MQFSFLDSRLHSKQILCQQRKVKCDREYPCSNCRKARAECISSSTQPPKRRKKRFPEAELLARIRRYEAHLKNYGADLDAINREEAPPPLITPKEEMVTSPPSTTIEQLEDGYRSLSVRQSLKHVEK